MSNADAIKPKRKWTRKVSEPSAVTAEQVEGAVDAAPALSLAQIKRMDYADEGAPEMDIYAGDKTPAFMEWVKDNHPDHYALRYANRITSR